MRQNRRVSLQLSIGLPNFGAWIGSDGWHTFARLAHMAEDAGIDRLVLVDHVSMGTNTSAYRWGRFPTSPDAPWPEPLTLLAGMAALTRRITLATGVVLPSLRGATLFAKTAATLDVMSQGRLELGVGIGWQREEYEAAGVDWNNRADIFDETLEATARLWNELPASFSGTHVRFTDTFVSPQPVHQNGVPLLIAGTLTPRNLKRIAKVGSGWIPIMGASLADITAGTKLVATALAESGRIVPRVLTQVPVPLERRNDTWSLDATMANIPAVIETGATIAHLPFHMFCADARDSARVFSEIRARFEKEVCR